MSHAYAEPNTEIKHTGDWPAEPQQQGRYGQQRSNLQQPKPYWRTQTPQLLSSHVQAPKTLCEHCKMKEPPIVSPLYISLESPVNTKKQTSLAQTFTTILLSSTDPRDPQQLLKDEENTPHHLSAVHKSRSTPQYE